MESALKTEFEPKLELKLAQIAMGGKVRNLQKRKQRVMCLFFSDPPSTSLESIAEACYRFSPQISIRGQEAIFLEVGKVRSLFSEQGLFRRLGALAQRFDVTPRISVADDVPTALALGRYNRSHAKNLPLEALGDYCSPFTVDLDVDKRVTKLVSTLRSLGVENLEDFSQLPAGTLASRFGSEGLELSRRICDHFSDPWPIYIPPQKVSERVVLSEEGGVVSCVGLEPLLFVLKGVVDRSMARLRGRLERASVIWLELELEPYSSVREKVRRLRVELPLPQGSVNGVMPILREKLSWQLQRYPLEAPVNAISFQVYETTPGQGAQRNFFDRRQEEAEDWDALVARLSNRLGKGQAFSVIPIDRHLPEKAWERKVEVQLGALDESGLFEGGNESEEEAKRPSRLLKRPEPLSLVGDYLVHGFQDKTWRILQWVGPERFSNEWWLSSNGEEYDRDYYRAQSECGDELWVYSTSYSRGKFYLHGYFD